MALGNQTDHLALLQFKQLISNDPYGILDSWNSSTHFCNWHGIICSPKHQRVTKLKLEGYKLHGSISPYVGNLSHMRFLNLGDNNFYGNIPQELGRLSRLRYLLLLNNSLSGEFPINLTKCSELKRMIGSLPSNMFHTLPNLQYFSNGGNNFSGHIPTSIANASTLTLLDIDTNHFVGQVPNLGTIPTTFGKFQKIQMLAMHGNKLSGVIPSFIGNLSQVYVLELDGNMFEGEVPTDGVFGNATQVAIIGNNKLCGGISQLHLPPCLIKGRKHTKHHKFRLIVVIVGVVSFLLILSFMITMYWVRKRNLKRNFDSPTIDQLAKVSYQDLHRVTNGFSTRNLIGSGSFGSVYRGNLVSEDNVVAVKVLNLQKKGARKSFFVECNALRNIRHRNLVKECEQLVIHCDLKPSNVLLDEDMVAHVIDFGIARLVSTICGNSSTIGIKGSVGYAPPEYGMGSEVSTCGDMYSFGILILEMLTGRRPTDEVFKDGQNLHNFVAISFPDNLGTIFYPHLVSRDAEVAEDGNNEILIPTTKECLVSLFRIGLICSMESPKERMNIVDVTREVSIIRKTFLTEPPTTLDLSHRLNIIIDVASALHYLHQECEQMVIHCDLKPSNVLLDDDMVAHVSNFGIARLFSVIDGNSHMNTSTIGYAPPEYGMGSEVSTCGDMYSFGILMLEMLTGKRPTDEVFEDGQNLHNFVGNLFPDNLIKILDPNIVSRNVENNEILIPSAEECLISLFKIGLVCSMESLKERMNIVDVNRELIIIKKAFLAGEIN
ncbi:hypothetical protein TSUD_235850 [Trifolium subterraneum]|nr:hypothetical protein TSUD_235850 [Trifolium subterraneum]